MRWDSVDPRRYLTDQARLFVRNHTVDADHRQAQHLAAPGLRRRPVDAAAPRPTRCHSRSTTSRLPARRPTSRCTSAPATAAASSPRSRDRRSRARRGSSARSAPSPGTGVRLRDVLKQRRLSPGRRVHPGDRPRPRVQSPAGSTTAAVRRPFPVSKALDDAILAWGANGEAAAPRPRLPGPPGAARLGGHRQHQVAGLARGRDDRAAPRRGTRSGTDSPAVPTRPTRPPLTVNPVRSAFELPSGRPCRRGKRRR